MNHFKHQKGFSLVEVVVASSITLSLLLVLANVMEDSARFQNAVEFKESLNTFNNEVRQAMANSSGCDLVMRISSGSAPNLNPQNGRQNLDLNLPSGRARAGEKFEGMNLSVNRLFLDNIQTLETSGTTRLSLAQVKLDALPLKNSFLKAGVQTKTLTTLQILSDSANSNRIISCAGEGTELSASQRNCTNGGDHGDFTFAQVSDCQVTRVCDNGAWKDIAEKCPRQPAAVTSGAAPTACPTGFVMGRRGNRPACVVDMSHMR